MRVLRKIHALVFGHDLLVERDDGAPVVGVKLRVQNDRALLLVLFERLLEFVMRDAEHDGGIHFDEASVAIEGETLVAAFFGQRADGVVVEPEIEHGVHHARHRGASARAHGDEQRPVGIVEGMTGDGAEMRQRRVEFLAQIRRQRFVVRVKIGADFRGQREAGRHRQAEPRHFGEAGALAAQQLLHRRRAVRFALTKIIGPFAHAFRCPAEWKRERAARAAVSWSAPPGGAETARSSASSRRK